MVRLALNYSCHTMRILTHNSLKCPAKDVAQGYPLKLVVEDMKIEDTEFDADFIKSQLSNLDWTGLVLAASAIGFAGIPLELTSELQNSEEFLRACHKLLLVAFV